MLVADSHADTNDPNHAAALERHTIASMEVSDLVSQMQETLSTINQTISSLSTAEHDARLDALEQDRDKHIQAIQAAFADESSAISQKRKAERDEILERRRKEDEERERRRRLEDEEMEARARKEDEERDADLKVHTQEVEDKTDALMAQVEDEATRMLAEAGDKLKALEERRKDINRRLDEQLQMPLPPPPSRTRRIARAAGKNTETRSMDLQAEAGESKRLESLPVEVITPQPMSNPPVKAHEDDDDAESESDQHHALSRQSSTETLPPTTYSPDPADFTLAVPGLNITAHKEADEGENNGLGVMSGTLSVDQDQDEEMDAALADMPQLSRVNSRDPSAERHAQAQVDAGDGDAHVADAEDGKQEKPLGHARSLTAELAWWEEQQKNGMNIPDIVGEVSDEGEELDARAELPMPRTIELPVSRRPSLAEGAEPIGALDLSEVTKGLGAFDKDALPAPLEKHVSDVSRRSSLVDHQPSPVAPDVEGSSRRSSVDAGQPLVSALEAAHDITEGDDLDHHEVSLGEVAKDSDGPGVAQNVEDDEAADLRGHIEPHASPVPEMQREVGSFSPRASGERWPLRHDNSPTPDTQDSRGSLTPGLTLDAVVADMAQHSSPSLEQHAQAAADVTSPASTADNNFQTASVATPVSHIEFMSKRVHDELDMVESSPVDVISIGSPYEHDSLDDAHERSHLTADASVANVEEHPQQGDKDDVASEAGSVAAADEHAVTRALYEDSQLQPVELAASGAAEHVDLDADADADARSVNAHGRRDSMSGDGHLEPMSKSLSEELQPDESSEDPETLFDDDPLAMRSHEGNSMVEQNIHASDADVEPDSDRHEGNDAGQVACLLHDQQNPDVVSRAASEVGDQRDSESEDELPLAKVESRSLADELADENMREEQSDYEGDEDAQLHHGTDRMQDNEKKPDTQVKPEAETAASANASALCVESESPVFDHKTGSLEEQPSASAEKEMGSDDEKVHEEHPSSMVDVHDEPASPTDSNLHHPQAGDLHNDDTVNVPTQLSGPASDHEDSDNEPAEVAQAVEASEPAQRVYEASPDAERTLPPATGLTEVESNAFFTPMESTGLRSSETAGHPNDDYMHAHGTNAHLDESMKGAPYDDEHTTQLEQHVNDLHDHHMPTVAEADPATPDNTREMPVEAEDMLDTEVAKLQVADPDTATENRRASVAESLDQRDNFGMDETLPKDNMLHRVATNESFEQDSNAGYESPRHKLELEHRYSATVDGHDFLFDDDDQSSAGGEENDDRDSTSDGFERDVRHTDHVEASFHVGSEHDGQLEESGKDALRAETQSPSLGSPMQPGQEDPVDQDKPEIPVAAQAMAVDEPSASITMEHVTEDADSTAGEQQIQQLEGSLAVSAALEDGHDAHDIEETTGPHYQEDQDSEHEEHSTEIAAFPLPPHAPSDEESAALSQTEMAEPVSPTAARGLAASRHNPERPQTPEAQAQDGDTSIHEASSPGLAETAVHEPVETVETFTPRDVTNISWSESQAADQPHQEKQQQSRLRSYTNETDMSQDTAPDLDVESTPMSQRSVSTLSSAPSSPVHAALLGDNHEPVIRNSWPNPASGGGLSSFVRGSSSGGGRARGESNLSSVSYSEDYMAQADGYGSTPSAGGKAPAAQFGGLQPSPMRLWQRREQSHNVSNGADEDYTGAGYHAQRPVSAMDLSSAHGNADSGAREDPGGVTPTTSTYRNSVPASSGSGPPGSGGTGGASSLFQRMRSVFENNPSAAANSCPSSAAGASPTVRSRPGSWYSRASTAAEEPRKETITAEISGGDKASWYQENSRRRGELERERGRRSGGYDDDLDLSDEGSAEDASLLSEENGHSYAGDERHGGYHRYDRHGRLAAGN